MGRKKVIPKKIISTKPKERKEEIKKIITYLPNTTKNKWDKIKGVEGDIVRFKTNDNSRQDFLKNKTYTLLYVGVYNDDLYFYYEIKK
jgi:hypothetical protein